MSIYVEGSECLPHVVRGKLTRTSGPLVEDGTTCVYLHVEDEKIRNMEAPLTFRVTVDLSLLALMAKPGDIVFVQWIPKDCESRPNVQPGPVAHATNFHLVRHVGLAYGGGFDKPAWSWEGCAD